MSDHIPPSEHEGRLFSATVDIRSLTDRIYQRFGKRLLDILIVLLAMPSVVLIIALFGLIICADGGPLFVKQSYIGRHARGFRLLRLRTTSWGFKSRTKVGEFLRKSSLDDLPQLVNVLLGHMSLVGPCPRASSQRGQYPCDTYDQMRPGLTGFWLISMQRPVSMDDLAALDRQYLEKMSLTTDLSILLRTSSLLLRRGKQ